MQNLTHEQQNQLDIARMTQKREHALALLSESIKWKPATNRHPWWQVVMHHERDILRGTEETVDRLIIELTELNDQALLDKLAESL